MMATTEAQSLVEALTPLASQMKRLDRRYLEGWQSYLARLGDGAQIAERRLVWLRALANEYSAEPAQVRAA